MSKFEDSEIWVDFANSMLLKKNAASKLPDILDATGKVVMSGDDYLKALQNQNSKLPMISAAEGAAGSGMAGELASNLALFVGGDLATRGVIAAGSRMMSRKVAAEAPKAMANATKQVLNVGPGVASLMKKTPLKIPGSLLGGAAATAAGGAAAKGGGAIVSGIGAAVGGVSLVTAGIAVAAVGVVALAGYGIYRYIDSTRADIENVLGHLDALDYEGTDHEATILSWRTNLQMFKRSLSLPVETGNPTQDAVNMGMAKTNVDMALKYLKGIYQVWPKIAPDMKDWGTDAKDFGDSLGRTISAYQEKYNHLNQATTKLSSEAFKMMDEPPSKTLSEIQDLENKIASTWAAPTYDNEEKKAIESLKNAAAGKATYEDYISNVQKIMSIKEQLEKKVLPQAEKWRKTRVKANRYYPLSKRAVGLPDKPDPNVVSGPVGPEQKPKAKPKPIDTVFTMQEQVNDLSVSLDLGTQRIKPDGVYGPNTASAVRDLIATLTMSNPQQFPERASLAKRLKTLGITGAQIMDDELMRETPRLMGRLTEEIDNIYKIHIGQKQRENQVSQQQQQQKQRGEVDPSEINWNKSGPSKPEVLAAFKTLYAPIGGTRENLYDYARQSLKMTDQEIFDLIYRNFPGWAPKNWSVPTIMRQMGNQGSI
jgi:peptidoglycan hydrolase-like protein with peptidoglycan-binding domain